MSNGARIILVAEDYDDARFLLKFLLECRGYLVIEAANGREAVELALKERPDLILMDIAMPELDGIAATGIIRESNELTDIPIIAVTAHSDNFRDEALKAGCNEVIRKPVEQQNLLSVISRFIHET